jgi:hypothetical protein
LGWGFLAVREFCAAVPLSNDKQKRNRLIVMSLRIIGSPCAFASLIVIDWLIGCLIS